MLIKKINFVLNKIRFNQLIMTLVKYLAFVLTHRQGFYAIATALFLRFDDMRVATAY